jgi:hypothetical protein
MPQGGRGEKSDLSHQKIVLTITAGCVVARKFVDQNEDDQLTTISTDGFSLYSGINDYIPEHFKSRFTEKIWLRNYSQ